MRDAAVGAVPTAGFDQWSVKVLISTSDAAIGWVGRERILFGFVLGSLFRCPGFILFRQYGLVSAVLATLFRNFGGTFCLFCNFGDTFCLYLFV